MLEGEEEEIKDDESLGLEVYLSRDIDYKVSGSDGNTQDYVLAIWNFFTINKKKKEYPDSFVAPLKRILRDVGSNHTETDF